MKFRVTIASIAFLLTIAASFGADIDGKWTGQYRQIQNNTERVFDDGNHYVTSRYELADPMNMEYTFKADGNILTGTTIGGVNGEHTPILDGKINGRKISFTVVADNMMGLQVEFKYKGEFSKNKNDRNKDEIKLKFDIGGIIINVRKDSKDSNEDKIKIKYDKDGLLINDSLVRGGMFSVQRVN